MNNDPRLEELFRRWQQCQDDGSPVSPSELCAGYPELRDEFEARLTAMGAVERFLQQQLTASDPAQEWRPSAETASDAGPATATPEPRPSASDFPFLSPPQSADEWGRLGGYRILVVLGKGGMGVVFRAEEQQPRRLVALKVMKPELAADERARRRFLEEGQAASSVEHPRVVPIYRVGEANGVSFLVMRLLRGVSLEMLLQKRKRLPVAEALRIGREMAEGLAAAHAAGLIHRDIKPGNVWLQESQAGEADRSDPASWPVVLLDFGLARAAVVPDRSHTQPSSMVGTPEYVPPEQAAGRELDARADLFSLGCVLYRMLTGKSAFAGRDLMAVLHNVALVQPAPPHEVDPSIPPGLSALVMRLLAKGRGERPSSSAAVVEEIRRLEAVPASRVEQQTASFAPTEHPRGQRWPVVAGGVGIGALVLLGVASAVFRPPSPTYHAGSSHTEPRSPVALKGDLDVLIWEKDNPRRQNLRLSDSGALPLKAGDRFAVLATVEPPAFVYVVWIGADGEVEPVYPWKPGDWSTPPAEEQPISSVRRPEALDEFYKLPQGNPGMETLVLLAMETPLPRDVDLRKALGAFGKQTAQDIKAAVWLENGRPVNDRPGREGRFDVERVKDPVLLAQQRIRDVTERLRVSYSRAVSFANEGK